MKYYVAMIQRRLYDRDAREFKYQDDEFEPAGNRHTNVAMYVTPASARRYNAERLYVDGRKDKEFRGYVLELDFDYLPRIDSDDPQYDYEQAERLMLFWAARADELKAKMLK